MVAFFIDCGLTSEMDSDAFDTLSEKVLAWATLHMKLC
jgi:hypothetical protein